ncbi:MAG: hypothetical protein K2K64_06815 [Muribaculaceae bacterium]|nr:hypothetical protein [Muribaculaceae bacterium]
MSSIAKRINILYFTGALLLASCSNGEPQREQVMSIDPVWVTLEFSQPSETLTRADGDKKSPAETPINSVIALLVDGEGVDKGKVCGISRAADSEIKAVAGQTGKYSVTLNMGLSSVYEREHAYNLYLFANISDGGYNILRGSINKKIADIGVMTENMECILPSELATKHIKYTTLNEDAANVVVKLEENTEYPKDQPYEAKDATVATQAGNLKLTPMQSRLDFVKTTGIEDFTYPVTRVGETAPEVKVQFKKFVVNCIAGKEYFFKQLDNDAVKTPLLEATDYSSKSVDISNGAFMYVNENVPSVPTFSNATYIEFQGILVADESTVCTAGVKDAITGTAHPDIYYYDDGTYQSALMTTLPESAANWRKLSYDAALGGYKVVYRRMIRHDAGEGKNLEDGKVEPMEYGIVRNHIYNIGINRVTSLPHPWSVTDGPENGKEDIDLKILVPKVWKDYHRTASEEMFD